MDVAEGADPGSFDSPLAWINFGVLGLLVLGFITGWIWTKVSVDKIIEERDRCLRERDRAFAERDEMAKIVHKEVLPLVGEFVTATNTFVPAIQQFPQLLSILLRLQAFLDHPGSGRD